ncbi:MAG: hypothetical protein R3F38_20045 [Gammaproteobacteria bacterium]
MAFLCYGGSTRQVYASLSFNYALMYGDVVRVMVLFYLVPV